MHLNNEHGISEISATKLTWKQYVANIHSNVNDATKTTNLLQNSSTNCISKNMHTYF